MYLLEVRDVSCAESGRTMLHPISFSLDEGDRLAIAGATGSGKTTLLKLIGGLLSPSTGSILFKGQRVLAPNEQLFPGHPSIAYLSQYFELRNHYNVYQLLEIYNKLNEQDAQHVYRICQIDHLLKRRTSQLSGGERQRIALAQILTTNPKILLLDEPFSNADMPHKMLMKAVLEEVSQQLRTAIILVTHDPLDALPWADQLIVLDEGKLVQKGSPEELYNHPRNEYVASLTGFYNMLSPSLARSLGFAEQKGTGLTIIRPEQLNIDAANGVEATIQSIDFMGAYYMINLLADGTLLKVISMQNVYRINEKVWLRSAKE